jgi:hypothetical protein
MWYDNSIPVAFERWTVLMLSTGLQPEVVKLLPDYRSHPLIELRGRDPLGPVEGVPVGIRAEFLPVLPVRYGLSAPFARVSILMTHLIASWCRATAGNGLSIGRAATGWRLPGRVRVLGIYGLISVSTRYPLFALLFYPSSIHSSC